MADHLVVTHGGETLHGQCKVFWETETLWVSRVTVKDGLEVVSQLAMMLVERLEVLWDAEVFELQVLYLGYSLQMTGCSFVTLGKRDWTVTVKVFWDRALKVGRILGQGRFIQVGSKILLALVKITLMDAYIYCLHLYSYDIVSYICVHTVYTIVLHCGGLFTGYSLVTWVTHLIGYLYTLFTLPQVHVLMDI